VAVAHANTGFRAATAQTDTATALAVPRWQGRAGEARCPRSCGSYPVAFATPARRRATHVLRTEASLNWMQNAHDSLLPRTKRPGRVAEPLPRLRSRPHAPAHRRPGRRVGRRRAARRVGLRADDAPARCAGG